jgi:hypothetical protein
MERDGVLVSGLEVIKITKSHFVTLYIPLRPNAFLGSTPAAGERFREGAIHLSSAFVRERRSNDLPPSTLP